MNLGIWVVVCQGAGFIGAQATTPALESWYPALNKPAFTPPNWVFAPVWVLLFLAMAVAAWRVQAADVPGGTLALAVFGIQLVFNIGWSVAFFGFRSPRAGLIEIVPFFLSVVLCTFLFWRIDPTAGALLLPYVAWVGFASYLNYGFWSLNR